jgi:hypothetical protein
MYLLQHHYCPAFLYDVKQAQSRNTCKVIERLWLLYQNFLAFESIPKRMKKYPDLSNAQYYEIMSRNYLVH